MKALPSTTPNTPSSAPLNALPSTTPNTPSSAPLNTSGQKHTSASGKRQRNVGGTFETEREGNKTFEKFVFLGLPPTVDTKSKNFTPQVLYEFPASKKLPFELIPFCFPEGVTIRNVKKSPSLSDVNNVMFGQLSALETSNNSFIFLVTCEEEVYHVICVVRDEILESLPTFMNSETPLVFVKHCTPRVYCLISKFPFFKLHYQVLFGLLASDRLSQLESRVLSGSVIRFSQEKKRENNFLKMLEGYYHQDVPQAGQSVSFTLPGHVYSFDFQCPSEEDEYLVSDWCFSTTASVLSLDSILMLLSSIQLERSVVIVCDNRGVLSSIILSVIPLLRPFIWQGPFIPILPSSLYEYLQAPVPFIVGILHLPESLKKEVEAHALVFRIDSQTVSKPKIPILSLPFIDSLYDNLQPTYNALRGLVTPYYDPYKTKPEHIVQIRSFFSIIKQHHATVLLRIKEKAPPNINWENENERKSLANKVTHDPKLRQFYTEFFFTQSFLMYVEENGLDLPPNLLEALPKEQFRTFFKEVTTFASRRPSKDLSSTLKDTRAGSLAFFKSQISKDQFQN